MNESIFDLTQRSAEMLKLNLSSAEFAEYADEHELSSKELCAVKDLFEYLADKKHKTAIDTLLRLSKLPVKQPKTFDNYDFSYLHGKQLEKIESLKTLSALYAGKNLAFIGPQGVGKTHLAMAFGYACCQNGFKTYFLKANELDQRLTEARRRGRTGSVINGLVKPSCLIIDEVGRCTFDKENTRLFFDMIDRRYSKEGPNTIIFTSNKGPNLWKDFFSEDDDLLCALDRAFDDATVFLFKGDSYRGRKLETVPIEAGNALSLTAK